MANPVLAAAKLPRCTIATANTGEQQFMKLADEPRAQRQLLGAFDAVVQGADVVECLFEVGVREVVGCGQFEEFRMGHLRSLDAG